MSGENNKENINWEEYYRQAAAAKESMAVQLEEALYLLEIREEQISILEKKAAMAVQLQSRVDESAVESQSLRQMVEEQQKKSAGVRSLKNELEEELLNSLQMEKSYLSLQEKHFHSGNELLVLQQEIKELSDLNKELLKELQKMGELQSRIELLLAENNELKEKLL